MYSVTGIIKIVKQPKGGYIPTRLFKVIQLKDIKELNDNENISPSLVGLAVDYLTRFSLLIENGKNYVEALQDAFRISLRGSMIVEEKDLAGDLSLKLIDSYKKDGLSDTVIDCACKLVGFDSAFRAGLLAYKDVREIEPGKETIENIIIMVKRSLRFFKTYGPIVDEGMVFPLGYSDLVSTGDADFMTEDCLWDFKVSKRKIDSKVTLQLGMYYVLGLRCIDSVKYEKLKYIGVYNPRLNIVFRACIEDILGFNKNVFIEIEENIIEGNNINYSK